MDIFQYNCTTMVFSPTLGYMYEISVTFIRGAENAWAAAERTEI